VDRDVALAVTASAWTLRPATADDRDFVVEVNRVAMGPYLEATFGWDEAELRVYFSERFDAAGGEVIEVDGFGVGELLVQRRPGELFLVRLALLPDWQGRGIGSAVVRMLIERARALETALVLDVFQTNPRAAQLYEALGFVRTGESETDVSMRLEPKL
jgi:ribosomal protein S18 acetylase RimI-like enzyme